ncbi:glycoside hydrolase family 19 protein [uncultured Zoogloea sp.]|uniref:glycoside hydrolase family 19 protein n=1 Tax=uncultured Zoogloea sp. TaxID=160237 RepID=UPI00261D139B|nr:glycoside hydrolase family 19 protein [uncultured Zoogloea sp.]
MNDAAFFEALRQSALFGGRLSSVQVRGITGLLDGFRTAGDGRAKTLAYGLATARREVGAAMVPVREGFKATDAEARAYVRRKGYRYAEPVGGQVYYGRGYPQLTWHANYRASSADVGVDLVANPDALLEPEIGARLLFRGLLDGRWNAAGKGLGAYLPDAGPDDLMNARRTVNVLDHWQDVAGYYRVFLDAIAAAGGTETLRDVRMDLTGAEADALKAVLAWRANCPPPKDFAAHERVARWYKEMPA